MKLLLCGGDCGEQTIEANKKCFRILFNNINKKSVQIQ
jgi:hypothetical protein